MASRRDRRIKREAPARRIGAAEEMSAAVAGQLGRCLARAIDHAGVLENIGFEAFRTVGELTRDASPAELLRRSHALRGLVLHGFHVLAELQTTVGHFVALAAVRDAECDASSEGREVEL